MMAATRGLAVAVAALGLVAGCTEKPQVSDKSVKKSATPAWSFSAAAIPAYSAPGWKADGDKLAWEAQINSRTQQGQNDYAAR